MSKMSLLNGRSNVLILFLGLALYTLTDAHINPCSTADFLLGVAYHAVPDDCSAYVMCEGLTNHTMQCGYGTLWNNIIKACLTPSQVTCSLCSGESDGTKLSYDLYCNSYWECQGGIPQAMCCAENDTFDGSSCVSGVCADPCPVAPASPSPIPCVFSDSVDGPEYYMENVPGFGLIRRDCPPGTNFNNVSCGCHDFVVVAPNPGCPTLVDIFYDTVTSTFVDNSTNKAWIAANSVALGATPVFSGSSSLVVYLLAGADYGNSLQISLVFSITPAATLTNQILMQNGICSENPAFIVSITDDLSNSTLMDVTLTLLTRSNDVVGVNSTLSVPKNLLANLEFEYPSVGDSSVWSFSILDDSDGSTVASDSQAMPVQETIARNHGALQIGSGDCSGSNGYTGFTGSVYSATIRSCIYGR